MTTNPKVLFINPPSMPYNHVLLFLENRQRDITNFVRQAIPMPMGILYLSAVLEKEIEGVSIHVIDFAKALNAAAGNPTLRLAGIEEFVDYYLEALAPKDFVPDFVGLSILFSTAHKTSGHIADGVKRRWPGVPVVVGGMHATNAVPSLLAMPSVDYVCRGEAESIISNLVMSLARGDDCEQIKGIYGRQKLAAFQARAHSGFPVIQSPAPEETPSQHAGAECTAMESAEAVDDIDLIPFPAWHLIPMEEYVHCGFARTLDGLEEYREATIMTTRGCPFLCTFCSSWTVHGRKMRYRSAANVVAELEILRERFRVNMVTPEDDLFTVKKARIIELCNAISDRFGKEMRFQFPNGLSVATLDREVIDAMVRMGMTLANIAVESGSAYVQKHIIKKNCDLTRARRVIQDCRDAGVWVRTYFVVGFPGESLAQIQETFDFAASIPSDWCKFNIAAPLVGTEMYHQMLDRGDIDATFNWDESFFNERQFDTTEVGAGQLKRMVEEANIRINFMENYNLRIGRYDRAIKLFEDILVSHPGHLVAQYCLGLAFKMSGNEHEYLRALEKCRKQLLASAMAREHLQLYSNWLPLLTQEGDSPLQSTEQLCLTNGGL